MKVTIVFPFRDRDMQRVKRSLDSLQEQTCNDFIVMFIDYGSNPNLSKEIKALVIHYSFVAYYYLHTQDIYRLRAHWWRLGRIFVVANVAMAAALAGGVHYFPRQATPTLKLAALLALCVVGASVYAIALLMSGFRCQELKPHDGSS